MDVGRQGHSSYDCRGKETDTSRGVGLGELCAGGSNAGGLGEEILVHLLPVSGTGGNGGKGTGEAATKEPGREHHIRGGPSGASTWGAQVHGNWVKTHRITEMVEWSTCKVVED